MQPGPDTISLLPTLILKALTLKFSKAICNSVLDRLSCFSFSDNFRNRLNLLIPCCAFKQEWILFSDLEYLNSLLPMDLLCDLLREYRNVVQNCRWKDAVDLGGLIHTEDSVEKFIYLFNNLDIFVIGRIHCLKDNKKSQK
jgi:hypothetical protein